MPREDKLKDRVFEVMMDFHWAFHDNRPDDVERHLERMANLVRSCGSSEERAVVHPREGVESVRGTVRTHHRGQPGPDRE